MTNRNPGFTLIELVVTVAMAAIVLTVGVPSFKEMTRNNRATTATNQLVGILNLARSEAIKRGVRVTVCKSSDGNSCTSSGNWSQGAIAFTDQNDNADYDSGTETLLRVIGPAGTNLTLTGNTNVADYISFVSTGRSQLTSGAFQSGTLTVCDDRSGNVGKNIVLSTTGRIHIATGISCP